MNMASGGFILQGRPICHSHLLWWSIYKAREIEILVFFRPRRFLFLFVAGHDQKTPSFSFYAGIAEAGVEAGVEKGARFQHPWFAL